MTNMVNLSNKDMDSEFNFEGYEALDGNDHKLGKIDSVICDNESMQPRYLVVDTGGWFSSKKFVVPVGDVSQIDDGEHHVYFDTLSKDTLESGRYPQYDDSWWDKNDSQGWNRHEREIATSYGQSGRTASQNERTDYSGKLYQRPQQGAQRLQLMEERLKANKERYQAGSVKLGKRITEHTETMNVPVTEERVVIERTPVSDRAATAREGDFGRQQSIDVPVTKERVRAEKERVVTEEVTARKEATQHHEQISDTVRKEELDVQDQGGLTKERGRSGDMTRKHDHDGGNAMRETGGTMREQGQGMDYRPDSPRPLDETIAERARRETNR